MKIFGGAKGSNDSDWEDSSICSRCGARKEFISVGLTDNSVWGCQIHVSPRCQVLVHMPAAF